LDFEQLEAFIQNNANVVQSPNSTTQTASGETSNQINNSNNNPTNLPESPPDSGSEPPYSPNVKVNQNLQMEHLTQQNLGMNTLTELHVPHHHNLLTPSAELYLANEHQHQQQQLLQINSLLHNKHDGGPLLPPHHHQAPQDHMLLYQVNQSGQIIELNHIHHQTQPTMSNRMYKNDIIELETGSPLGGPLPAIHDIQQSLQGNINDNLQMMGENFTQLSNHTVTNGTVSVKKRKGSSHAFPPDGDGNLKAFIKSESSEFCYDDLPLTICLLKQIFRADEALWRQQK
jgi:hypothetical protein